MKLGYIIMLHIVPLTLLYSCAKDSTYTLNNGIAANSIISISSIQPDSVYADSNSTMTIRVNISPQTDSVENITLTTSAGSINGLGLSATVSTNLSRYVDFFLKSGQVPGPVSLRASVLTNYFADSVIEFIQAYPDTVIMQISSNVIQNTPTTFTVNLLRYSGYPSITQKIVYSALDSTGTFQGSFSQLSTFEPGSALNVTYTPPANFTGHIKIQTQVIKEDGSMISSPVETINIE